MTTVDGDDMGEAGAEAAALAWSVDQQLEWLRGELVDAAAECNAGRHEQQQAIVDRIFDHLQQLADNGLLPTMLVQVLWPWALTTAEGQAKALDRDLARLLRAEQARTSWDTDTQELPVLPPECPDPEAHDEELRAWLRSHRRAEYHKPRHGLCPACGGRIVQRGGTG